MQNNIDLLQDSIGYHFKDKYLILKCLTHPSYCNEHSLDKVDSNQRLEFLGDAVLEQIISYELYNDFPNENEGSLTKKRSNIVCEENLSKVALDIDLYKYLLHGKSLTNEIIRNNKNILCDSIESLIAGVYLDGGYEEAKKFVINRIYNQFEDVIFNYKTTLKEYCNKEKINLEYRLINEYGLPHNKTFEVCCVLDSVEYKSAFGTSKKRAEQLASNNVLIILKEKGMI